MLKRIIGAAAMSALLASMAVAQQTAPPATEAAPSTPSDAAASTDSLETDTPDGAASETAETGEATGDTTVATVNGDAITSADVAYARATLGEAVQQVPDDQRDEMVLSLLIDMQLMANAAERGGVDETAAFKKRIEFQRMQALQESYMQDLVANVVTEDAVAQRYQEEVAKLQREQVSASHILVPDEVRARELISEIEGGADFAALAQENSQDPGSAQQGGSLGFFSKGQMVAPFEEAAFSLEPGDITEEPVQSQFGWHVIRLDEKRTMPLPPLEQVAPQIQQVMVREAYMTEVEKLKSDASIEMSSGTDGATGSGTDGETGEASDDASAGAPQ